MSKGKIIFYDDDPEIITQFEGLMADSGFQIIRYTDLDLLRKDLSDFTNYADVKALIFDLARSKAEGGLTKDFDIIKDIEDKFHRYRIPIFIHSAFANDIPNFENSGTVWKIEKSGDSLLNITEIISKLDESGFIEAFTPGGIIEQNLFEELHKSFTEQFRKGDIEKIIETVKGEGDDYKKRAIKIFKRIAVRSLLSEIMAPMVSEKDAALNAIEHYYRRISKLDFWTGDIIKEKKNSNYLLILTPRCNIFKDKELLVCPIIIADFPNEIETKHGKKIIGYALTNNPEVSGYNRYLPPSPIFEGGKIELSKYSMKNRDELAKEYDVIITLSDELTNEILGKFGAYFFRTGITPWDSIEVMKLISKIKSEKK